jgi:rhodanese-related sulfurtransferase
MRIPTVVLLVFALLACTAATAADDGFPGRKEHPEVPVLELADLHSRFNDVVLVDARSHYEFDTLRIKGAVNIPVAEKSFEQQVAELRASTDKPIVFYCNGRTCMKSYLAVEKCQRANISNTFAYDAGMFEWAKAHPDRAELLGKSPVRDTDIIASATFKKRLLDPKTFSTRVFESPKPVLVLDVRDKYQRGATGFFIGKERWASLDDKEKLSSYVKQAKAQNRTLLIYDAVGKQVRWLQYMLEAEGVQDYYFMQEGAKGFYEKIIEAEA